MQTCVAKNVLFSDTYLFHRDFIASCFLTFCVARLSARHQLISRKLRDKRKRKIIDSHVCVPTSKGNREC